VEHRRGNAEKGRHGDVCGEARETIMRAESKGAQAQWRYRRRPREGGVLEAIQGAAMKVYETADGGGGRSAIHYTGGRGRNMGCSSAEGCIRWGVAEECNRGVWQRGAATRKRVEARTGVHMTPETNQCPNSPKPTAAHTV
jgi:hypothetical protein